MKITSDFYKFVWKSRASGLQRQRLLSAKTRAKTSATDLRWKSIKIIIHFSWVISARVNQRRERSPSRKKRVTFLLRAVLLCGGGRSSIYEIDSRNYYVRAKVRFAGRSLKTLSSSSRAKLPIANVSWDALLARQHLHLLHFFFFFFFFVISRVKRKLLAQVTLEIRGGKAICLRFVHAIGRTRGTRESR